MSVIFQPNVLQWLFGSGIGTNLGAAIVWVPIGAFGAWLWGRAKLTALHQRHDAHAESLQALHDKVDRLADRGDSPG